MSLRSLEWKLMLQCFLLLVGFILGFLICIPIGISKSDFDGSCLLYTEIKYTTSLEYNLVDFGSTSSCNYVIYAGVTALLLGFVMLLGSGLVLFRSFKEGEQIGSSWIVALLQLVATALMAFFMFVAACIVSVGRKNFCDSAIDTAEKQGVKINCKHMELTKLNGKKFPSFVSKLRVAEVSAWLSVLIWISLCILSVLRIILQRRARNSQGRDQPSVVRKDEGDEVPRAI